MHEVDLGSLLTKVTMSLQDDIQETNATIGANFDGIGQVTAIPAYLESIFYNLISNAIKYRHPRRRPDICITSRLKNDFVEIEFADNGLGIDVEMHKENLFNLYKRFHFHAEGRGMGLYLVKTQINALGGNIDLKSKEGVGSVFTLSIRNHLSPKMATV
jgi:signal transduction histidine kinase